MHGRGGVGSGRDHKLMMGLVCYDIVCKMDGVGWTIIQKPEPVCQFKLFFFTLSFLRQSKQAKQKKSNSRGRGKIMMHVG